MSKLRTYQLQNPDSASVNIELTQNGGAVVSGVLTATTATVTDGLTVNGPGINVTGIVTASAGFQFGSASSYLYGSGTDSVFLRVGDGPYVEFTDAGSNVLEMGNASSHLALIAAGNEKVRITPSGYVGIGTDNPSWGLDSQRNANVQARFIRNDAGDSFLRVNSHTGNIVGLQLGDNTDADKQMIRADNTNNALIFNTANGEKLRITSSGDVNVAAGGSVFIGNGNLVFSTSGTGIDFSATSDASGSTSELLDDYEEGTFTPVFGIGSGFTYSQQHGRYIKIGNRVIFNIFLTWSANSNTGGNTFITGFPYTTPNLLSSYGAASFTTNTLSLPSGTYNIVAQITPTSPNVFLYGAVSGGNKVAFPWQNLGSSGEIIMSGQYIAV